MKYILTCSGRLMLSCLLLVTCAVLLQAAEQSDYLACKPEQDANTCLEAHSMLYQAAQFARKYSGQGTQWQYAYAEPRPQDATKKAPVWFTAYPTATITRPGHTVLQTLGDEALWETFKEIGIRAMHTGPLKRAGGITCKPELDGVLERVKCQYTMSVDGGFDRISLDIDPAFGTEEEYVNMVRTAKYNEAIIVGDIVPGHTGKGPDFRLAERNYKDYPGIYHMIEIEKRHWSLLPNVDGQDSANLKCDQVKKLKEEGYIVGALERVIFREKGIKDTNWSATDRIIGADGEERRWVYLHYFKSGEPTLNWLDPSFAAQRLVVGDILKSKEVLGAEILRLDANGFLGLEKGERRARDDTACLNQNQELAWSEGHPLSIVSNKAITMLMRKLGGFTFQELNLTLEDIKAFSEGSDLSYDFITRPAFVHALITGDAKFLRLMMKEMRCVGIKPVSLIHGLQNHDEVTYELVHLANNDKKFTYGNEGIEGSKLANTIREEAYEKVTIKLDELNDLTEEKKKEESWWNIEGWNGICGTMTGIIAAALSNELGIKDPYHMSDDQKKQVKKAHLLLVMFNAMQPGVLAISGWDLVGALPLTNVYLQEEKNGPFRALLKDKDCRWLNRGAYDLMGINPDASQSSAEPKLPKAQALYGTLPEQLQDPDSFVSQLKKILDIREKYKIHLAEQIEIPEVESDGLVVMVHEIDNISIEITALNFGSERIEESVKIEALQNYPVYDVEDLLLNMKTGEKVSDSGKFSIILGPREVKLFFIQKRS